MENFQSVENARAYLREQGYFVDNLWHVDDVKSMYQTKDIEGNPQEVSDEVAQEILNDTLTNEWVVSQVRESMDIITTDYYNLILKDNG